MITLYAPIRLKRWTTPANYFGSEWPQWYGSGFGVTRDSDALDRANFDAALKRIKAASNGMTLDLEIHDIDHDGCESVAEVEESHWAVGWVKWIAIHESDEAALQCADEIQEEMENYPVVDDELFGQYEEADCSETWENCFNEKDRIIYFRNHSHTVSSIGSLLRAVRGDWGEAAGMLNCPSDILH